MSQKLRGRWDTATLHWRLGAALLAAAGMFGCGTAGKSVEPLRTVGEVARLREGDMAAGRPVKLRGVITLLDPNWRLLAIQDESGGMLVDWPPLPANLRIGDRVEVTGATSIDNHVPSIVTASVRVTGTGSMPRPQPVSPAAIACGSDPYRLVEVEFKPEERLPGDANHTTYFISQQPCGRLEIIGRTFRPDPPGGLVGRRIRVRGVPLGFYSPAGTLDHVRLMFDNRSDVDILDPPAAESSGAAAGESSALPEIRSVAAVKALPPAEASRGYPVRVEGVVTAINSRHIANGLLPPIKDVSGYFLQEGSIGICVFEPRAQGAPPRVGQRLRLSGVTDKGGFAPVIRQESLEVLGTAPLPIPVRINPGDVFHGWEENVWAELEGVGTAVVTDGDDYHLEMFAGPRRFLVWFSDEDSPDRLQPLIDAKVRVQGLYGPVYTAGGELEGFRVVTNSPAMVKVLEPPQAASEFRTIASLSQFDLRGVPRRRFRTAGRVTYRDTLGRLYLQDGASSVRVIGNGPGDPPLDSWATVEGVLAPDAGAPQIEHVRWLSAVPGSPVAPARALPEALVAGDLKGRMVAVEGFLEDRRTSAGRLQLILLAGRSRFAASMEAPASGREFPDLRPGALLRLTGISVAQPPEDSTGTGLATLWLRNSRDIVVVRCAPWWDVRRALYAAFAASLLLILMLAGVVWLRKNLVAQMALRAKLEEQLLHAQKLEGVGRLAGGVAHDFNNLLTVINGYSSLLLDRMEPDDANRASLEQIRMAGKRAAELTQKLLTFSRKQLAQPKALDPNLVVTEAVEMFGPLIGAGIEVTTRLSPDVGQVLADPAQLHQVLMNLLVNARDAMPGGGKLVIETGNVEVGEDLARRHPGLTPGSYVYLGVTDTGSGMSEEVKRHLFEPFFTTKEAGRGTGLGLATIHGVVRQSAGWVGVTSELGHGATFHIYLPRIAAGVAAQPAPEAPPAPLKGLATILVVEDQLAVRKFVATVLESYDYEVLQASNGPEAIALAEQYPKTIHLLLTDVVMPFMNGHALADRLTKARPEMKVLYASGYDAETIGRDEVPGSGLAYVQKPFTAGQLSAKVREVLAARDHPVRILVADDEPGIRGFLRTVLEAAGYRVIEAANGKQVLEKVRAGSVDLVITDLVMPEQEGLETIRALRREAAGIGIIAMSGAFGGQYLELARQLGAQAVLTKPVSRDVLLAQVADLLKPRG